MIALYWNALRAGDRVAVHDDLDADLTMYDGVVRLVQTHGHEAHDVGIRLERPDSKTLRPRRQAVHLLPLDRRLPCWRCDVIAASGTERAGKLVAA